MSCLVTNDKEYLGQDNIDMFDALIFKIRFFKTDEKGKPKLVKDYFLVPNIMLIFLAKAAIPSKRSPHQRYILSTHESSRAENIPPFVNEKYLSR